MSKRNATQTSNPETRLLFFVGLVVFLVGAVYLAALGWNQSGPIPPNAIRTHAPVYVNS